MSAQSLDALVDEMIEFGIPLDSAVLIAPALLPLLNDPRGLKRALADGAPDIAAKLGMLTVQ